jgi:hypothetical protein
MGCTATRSTLPRCSPVILPNFCHAGLILLLWQARGARPFGARREARRSSEPKQGEDDLTVLPRLAKHRVPGGRLHHDRFKAGLVSP